MMYSTLHHLIPKLNILQGLEGGSYAKALPSFKYYWQTKNKNKKVGLTHSHVMMPKMVFMIFTKSAVVKLASYNRNITLDFHYWTSKLYLSLS